MAGLDLNADPVENHDGQSSGEDLTLASLRQHPFDLNVFPDEHYGSREDQILPREFDLNVVPPEAVEEEKSFQRLGCGPSIQYHWRNELSNDKRVQLYHALVWRSKKGRITKEVAAEVASSFSVSMRTVWRIWKQGTNCLKRGADVDVSTKRHRCGRKKIQVDLSKMPGIDLSKRTTLADLSRELKVSKYKLWMLKNEGLIKRHSNNIKPLLNEENKKERLRWCFSMLEPNSIGTDPIFKDLCDIVFIDEKWFYLKKKTGRYYILADEEEPYRTCKNKNFMPKVMFLCAIARPRMDNEGKCTFDGKIGCFPFITFEPARRRSKNRAAGTLEMKPIISVTKDVMCSFVIGKVLPAIREKWPSEDAGKPIFIQQDNARPHIDPHDPIFCEAAQQDGFNIKLISQPPNSPDFNILDLGFFSSIQSIQYRESPRTLAELVAVVQKAFEDYDPTLSNRIFSSLQLAMIEAMKVRGGNNYKMPHVNKPLLEKENNLPKQLKCDLNLVKEVCMQING